MHYPGITGRWSVRRKSSRCLMRFFFVLNEVPDFSIQLIQQFRLAGLCERCPAVTERM